MENAYNYEQIEAYLLGQLSPSDNAAFEKAIQEDAGLAESVEQERDLMIGVVSVGQEALKDKISTIAKSLEFDAIDVPVYGDLSAENLLPGIEEVGRTQLQEKINTIQKDLEADGFLDKLFEEVEAENKAKKQEQATTAKVVPLRPMRRILSIAASVLLLVSVGTSWYANSNFSDTGLIENNYSQPDTPGTLSGSTTINATFQNGLNSYLAEKDLIAANTAFLSITPDDNQYLEAQYYLGHIATQQKAYSKAITHFQTVFAKENLPAYINRDKLEWDLTLARLGAGMDINPTLEAIIAKNKVPFSNKAKKLQAQLTSPWRKITF